MTDVQRGDRQPAFLVIVLVDQGAIAGLAGGSKLGLRHGQYLKLGESMPLSNVFVTMLDRLNVPVKSFADSQGECSALTV